MTKEAGVIPLLQVTSFVTQSIETIEATLRILYDEKIQDRQINSILNILKSSGYYGINITFSYIDSQNYPLYNNYLSKLALSLYSEGLLVFVTLAPKQLLNKTYLLNPKWLYALHLPGYSYFYMQSIAIHLLIILLRYILISDII